MDLHKIHHPDNFDFIHEVISGFHLGGAGGAVGQAELSARSQFDEVRLRVEGLGEDVFRLTVTSERWPERLCLTELHEEFSGPSHYALTISEAGGLHLSARELGDVTRQDGPSPELVGPPGHCLGISADAFLLRLESAPGERFFGMGEKWGPLEKSGQRSQFWTTDVWADYSPKEIGEADVDCPYASVPYLIIERSGVYFGILLDNPYRAFMATNPQLTLTGEDIGAKERGSEPADVAPTKTNLYLGTCNGRPIYYFLVGPSLRDLTKKLQRLVGVTPRPPLWALGHHQSRWGYRDLKDLQELSDKFCEHKIPNDGLWLDIDYMEGFRVFTAVPEVFGSELSIVQSRGQRVVPILDPGVKVDVSGYSIYSEGIAGGHFCLAPSRKPYVGVVWPGETHFPDFSQEKTRDWWASHTAALAARGLGGFWIDMNDPSTGPIENCSMLFRGGTLPHESMHNQYALGMAEATRDGLSRARPDERPFVLSRSAFTTSSRFTAVWTGDNISSFRHLAASIPTSLNLALSGIPFNGPDVPGFGGDATAELAVRFYQAMFLFPFLRNHSVKGSRQQEPWAFSDVTLKRIRRVIRLRYRFLPYLYQLFIEQERAGEPILAPLFIDTASGALAKIEDEFLVGRLLQAPVVSEGQERLVHLPAGDWHCLRTGVLHAGPRELQTRVPLGETPLYVRGQTILPLCPKASFLDSDGALRPAAQRLKSVDFHLFFNGEGTAAAVYEYDDALTLGYKRGQSRRLEMAAESAGAAVQLNFRAEGDERLGLVQGRIVLHGGARRLFVNGREVRVHSRTERFTGAKLNVRASEKLVF